MALRNPLSGLFFFFLLFWIVEFDLSVSSPSCKSLGPAVPEGSHLMYRLLRRAVVGKFWHNGQLRWSSWKTSNLDFDLAEFVPERVRNFCIIAHIDHGKTTLSDALLRATGTLQKSNGLYLDKLQVEKERGITVKANTASMRYQANDGVVHLLNLIDTPGHVDFAYEVSRSMSACEGALLLVDASQGIQAQTTANLHMAQEHGLTIVPVLTKIDMPLADVEEVSDQIQMLVDVDRHEILQTSARKGIGITELLQAICDRVPAPDAVREDHAKAMLFDAWPNAKSNRITSLIALKQGRLQKGDVVLSYASNKKYTVGDIGLMHPEPVSSGVLHAGQVGYVELGMTTKKEALIGDTLFLPSQVGAKDVAPFPGFKTPRPTVFASIFPVNPGNYQPLRTAVDKLCCNDASVEVTSDLSDALGSGLRCGFLGVLHMSIYCERLLQEFGEEVIITPPSVLFQGVKADGTAVPICTAADWVEYPHVTGHLEPMVLVTIVAPATYRGDIIQLCQDRRGVQMDIQYVGADRVSLQYVLPLNEIVQTFYDRLKSMTSGYASMEYEDAGYEPADLVKVDLLLNGNPVDCMSAIMHKSKADRYARLLVSKLKEVLPRQLVDIAIQATIRKRVIARETIKQLRKDVTAKCYGGDMSRKRKLLDRQKEGKKRMRSMWNVQMPQEAFLEVMKLER